MDAAAQIAAWTAELRVSAGNAAASERRSRGRRETAAFSTILVSLIA
jgi:cytochrome c553